MVNGAGNFTVIPGRAKREPGIHNHDRGLWIPDLRQVAHPGMTSYSYAAKIR
ncbi:MAG: hypothetical protein QOJ84_845 [Bradyrhizobium sp.]|jgi:hypothetical protein|nr:hypothetical protein [Bradyrhizobium sp.]